MTSRRTRLHREAAQAAVAAVAAHLELGEVALRDELPAGWSGPVGSARRRRIPGSDESAWLVTLWESRAREAASPKIGDHWFKVMPDGTMESGDPNRTNAAALRSYYRDSLDPAPTSEAVREVLGAAAEGMVVLTGTEEPPEEHTGPVLHLRPVEGVIICRFWGRWPVEEGADPDRFFRFLEGRLEEAPASATERNTDRYAPIGGAEPQRVRSADPAGHTTIRVDPDTAAAVQRLSEEVGESVRVLSSELLRSGLRVMRQKRQAGVDLSTLSNPARGLPARERRAVTVGLDDRLRAELDEMVEATGWTQTDTGVVAVVAGMAVLSAGG